MPSSMIDNILYAKHHGAYILAYTLGMCVCGDYSDLAYLTGIYAANVARWLLYFGEDPSIFLNKNGDGIIYTYDYVDKCVCAEYGGSILKMSII